LDKGFHDREFRLPGESLQDGFFRVSERPDHVEFALEIGLVGEHGADLPSEEDVQKQGLDDVVFVVSQGNLLHLYSRASSKSLRRRSLEQRKQGLAFRL